MRVVCISIITGTLLILAACGGPGPTPGPQPLTTMVMAIPFTPPATPHATPTEPLPTDTIEPPTRPPLPTSTPSPFPSLSPSPTFTPRPIPPSATAKPPQASEARVIYHNGFYLDGVGHYEQGSFPWLDLLCYEPN